MTEDEATVRLDQVVLFFDLRNRQLAVLPRLGRDSQLPPCLITFASLEALCHELTPKKESP